MADTAASGLALQQFFDFMATGNQDLADIGGGNIPDPNLVFDDMWQQMLDPDDPFQRL